MMIMNRSRVSDRILSFCSYMLENCVIIENIYVDTIVQHKNRVGTDLTQLIYNIFLSSLAVLISILVIIVIHTILQLCLSVAISMLNM